MGEPERRGTERFLLAVPIRVISFGAEGGGFTEDTYTVDVNQAGARIALKHRVAAGDTLRIINLETFSEADFRVVGPTRLDSGETAEWGVECAEPGRNVWGIEFAAPIAAEKSRAGALLQCQGCGKQVVCVLTLMEVEILDSTGALQRLCDQCGELSSWTYADVERLPKPPESAAPTVSVLPADPIAPPSDESSPALLLPKKQIERRAHRRLPLKLPVLVRTFKGDQELAKTENISKGGFAACLALKLAVGEVVKVVCPYTEGGHNLEQKAEVRRRVDFSAGTRWLYGFRYVA
jgi:hypothetical protein